jgi:hypothetical protein
MSHSYLEVKSPDVIAKNKLLAIQLASELVRLCGDRLRFISSFKHLHKTLLGSIAAPFGPLSCSR